jgi:hypothetical protein
MPSLWLVSSLQAKVQAVKPVPREIIPDPVKSARETKKTKKQKPPAKVPYSLIFMLFFRVRRFSYENGFRTKTVFVPKTKLHENRFLYENRFLHEIRFMHEILYSHKNRFGKKSVV